MLAVKGLLDGLAAMGFVATFGWSPLLAAVPEPDPVAQRAKPRVPLAGEIPSPANPPPGCVFMCPAATTPPPAR